MIKIHFKSGWIEEIIPKEVPYIDNKKGYLVTDKYIKYDLTAIDKVYFGDTLAFWRDIKTL